MKIDYSKSSFFQFFCKFYPRGAKVDWKRLGVLLGLLLCLCGCAHRQLTETTFFAMDTVIRLQADGSQEDLEQARAELERLDRLLSIEGADSEIARVNRDGGGTVSQETADLLQRALDLSRATGGAYDYTIEPVVDLWGWYGGDPAVPDPEALEQALSLVDYEAVTLDGGTVSFGTDGMGMDLGGIAKGYAAGRAAEILKEVGVTSACLSLGGNIRVMGTKPGGSHWTIGITDPQDPANYILTLSVSDCAVVTSGGYHRYFEEDGQRWHHILDPDTGYPAGNGLASVTIVAEDDTLADGLSTALFVMGLEDAADFWQSGAYAFEAVFILEDGRVFATEGLEGRLACDTDITILTR